MAVDKYSVSAALMQHYAVGWVCSAICERAPELASGATPRQRRKVDGERRRARQARWTSGRAALRFDYAPLVRDSATN